MTEPEQTTTDAEQAEPQPLPPVVIPPVVNVVGAVVVGPGGAPLVALQLHYGHSQHTLVMTPETAEQLGPLITGVCAEVVAQAKRARAGLVVAGPDDLRGLVLPPNGR